MSTAWKLACVYIHILAYESQLPKAWFSSEITGGSGLTGRLGSQNVQFLYTRFLKSFFVDKRIFLAR